MPSFACPRCGAVSHNRHDALEGYCDRCSSWTGRDPLESMQDYYERPVHMIPGGPVSCEQLLTPQVLLDDPRWAYEGTQDEGGTAVYRFDFLHWPWVSSWRPDLSMGAFTADWTASELRLCVSTEVLARAAMERLPGADPLHAWSWDELRALHEQARTAEYLRRREAGLSSAEAMRPDALLYACPRCGTQFTVPPGHGEPVLCGSHSPPERMSRASQAGGTLPWSRPDADPLADLWEAMGLIETARASFGPIVAAGMPTLAVLSIEVHGELGQDAGEAMLREIQRGQVNLSTSPWLADAIAVWAGCKDPARRERSLAELAQDAADAAPQIAPAESGTDAHTAARWSSEDPGDVVL